MSHEKPDTEGFQNSKIVLMLYERQRNMLQFSVYYIELIHCCLNISDILILTFIPFLKDESFSFKKKYHTVISPYVTNGSSRIDTKVRKTVRGEGIDVFQANHRSVRL